MSITVQCPKCGKKYAVPDSAAGQRATCKPCQVQIRVPAPKAVPAASVGPSAAGALSVDDTVQALNQLLAGAVAKPSEPARVVAIPKPASKPAQPKPAAAPHRAPAPVREEAILELTELDVVDTGPSQRAPSYAPAPVANQSRPAQAAAAGPNPYRPPTPPGLPLANLRLDAFQGPALTAGLAPRSKGFSLGGFSLANRTRPLAWSLGGGLALAVVVAMAANSVGRMIVPASFNQVVEESPLEIKGFIDPVTMAALPARPPMQSIGLGIDRTSVQLPHGRLILYLPTGAAAGSIGCVFIAPAGTNQLHGSDISEDSNDEHLPYVHAGFAVCNYALDGNINTEPSTVQQQRTAFQQYRDSNSGLNNATDAINYVLARVPEVAPGRLYAAGHSSAGAVALLLAAHDARIRGCIAYAAPTDFLGDQGGMFVYNVLDKQIPGALKFIERTTPRGHESRIKSPVFLFHAMDDTRVEPRFSSELAERLKASGKKVELVTVPNGEHRDSMISAGIPRAIVWLQALDRSLGGNASPAPSFTPAVPGVPFVSPIPPPRASSPQADGFTAPLGE